MRGRLMQWYYWFIMPWRFRHLPQCYRSALTGLACTFDGEPPPPEGKCWKAELFIDPEHMGLGMAQLEDQQTGAPAPEWEMVPASATTGSSYSTATVQFIARPRRLGGFGEG